MPVETKKLILDFVERSKVTRRGPLYLMIKHFMEEEKEFDFDLPEVEEKRSENRVSISDQVCTSCEG